VLSLIMIIWYVIVLWLSYYRCYISLYRWHTHMGSWLCMINRGDINHKLLIIALTSCVIPILYHQIIIMYRYVPQLEQQYWSYNHDILTMIGNAINQDHHLHHIIMLVDDPMLTYSWNKLYHWICREKVVITCGIRVRATYRDRSNGSPGTQVL
jgi:hypothetical protein